MLHLFTMALRDLGRNRRRSFFSALALAIGLALLLLIASVLEGEMRGAMDTAIRLQSGHLQVRAASYDETKASLAWEDLVASPQTVAAQVAALEPVVAASPRLFASGIVASGNDSAGVRVIGIDPASPASAPYRDGVLSGALFAADDRSGVLLGQTLADRLKLRAGDSLALLVNTAEGDVAQQNFEVRGVFSTRTPAFDDNTVLLPLSKAQAISGAGDHASAIFVLLKDRDQADAVAGALQSSRLKTTTWRKMNAILLDTEQMSRGYMAVIYVIVLAVTATVIVNTLIMAVFERTREIGILSALGMKSARIMGLFFAESALLAIAGIAMGLLIGGAIVAYATRVGFYIGNVGANGVMIGDTIYAHLTPNDTAALTAIAFVITLLAALYPALLAARMEPVDALRGGQ